MRSVMFPSSLLPVEGSEGTGKHVQNICDTDMLLHRAEGERMESKLVCKRATASHTHTHTHAHSISAFLLSFLSFLSSSFLFLLFFLSFCVCQVCMHKTLPGVSLTAGLTLCMQMDHRWVWRRVSFFFPSSSLFSIHGYQARE